MNATLEADAPHAARNSANPALVRRGAGKNIVDSPHPW
jgi:hypothetical protein